MRHAALAIALLATLDCAASRGATASPSRTTQSAASANDAAVVNSTTDVTTASTAPIETASSTPPPAAAVGGVEASSSPPPERSPDAPAPLVAPFDRLASVPAADRIESDARAYCASAFRVTHAPAGWAGPPLVVRSLRHGIRIGPVVTLPRAASATTTRLLERLAPVIEHCHDQGRSRVPDLHGAIVADVATNAAGEVTTFVVRDTNVSVPGVSRCVARAVGRIQFERPPREVVMRVPVVLCAWPSER